MESICVDSKYLNSLVLFFYIKIYLYSENYKTAKVSDVFFLQTFTDFLDIFFDFNATV